MDLKPKCSRINRCGTYKDLDQLIWNGNNPDLKGKRTQISYLND